MNLEVEHSFLIVAESARNVLGRPHQIVVLLQRDLQLPAQHLLLELA